MNKKKLKKLKKLARRMAALEAAREIVAEREEPRELGYDPRRCPRRWADEEADDGRGPVAFG